MRLMGGLFRTKTLYFPGCTTRTQLKEIEENYESILRDLKIDFIKLDRQFCCGQPIKQLGYDDEFEELKSRNKKVLESKKVARVVTNDPHCYETFKKAYNYETEHVLKVILRNKHFIDRQERGKIVYHDPCFLVRHANILETPRKILREIGYELVELKSNRKNTRCCGGGLRLVNPSLAKRMAEKRLGEVQNVRRIVTSCPTCYIHLKENAKDVQVYELSQLLKGAIRR